MAQVLSIHSATGYNRQAPQLVGRETELAQLHSALTRALSGERQCVFLSGEPGIGKTAVLDTFLAQLSARPDLHIAQGQCVEHYGPGEAYLPLLEASRRLCRAPDGGRAVAILKQHAPTWLIQLPALLKETELEALQRRVQGSTRERMLREMAEAAEVLTAEHGVVLVLEDLHWSDHSTLDFIAYLAQRREPARLLVVGSYRPAEVLASGHPLKRIVQELRARAQCEELPVAPLSEEAVGQYVTRHFTGAPVPPELPGLIHHRTGGNPLFVVNVLGHLTRQGVLREAAGGWTVHEDFHSLEEEVPENLRQLIEQQLGRLSDEQQRVLEGASVAGMEFAVAAVAAGVRQAGETIEARCEVLAGREQFIEAGGVAEWPDGTLCGQYRFRHALYQHVLYDRITAARRVRLHKRIGERKEAAYEEQAGEIAGELAVHFAAGRDFERAVRYSKQAAETAIRCHAHQEAVIHVGQGLAYLQRLPDTPERAQQELLLQITLGEQLTSLQGFGVEEVEQAFARARELCRRLGETPQLFRVVLGLWAFYVERAELATARELAEQLLRFAQHVQSPPLYVWAHLGMGITLHFAGEQVSARRLLEECVALHDPQYFHSSAPPYDPAVLGHATLGPVLWLLGYPDQALEQSQKGLASARALTQPYSVIYALNLVTRTHLLRGEPQATHEHIEELISLCREQGFASYLALSLTVQGWLLAEQGRQQAGIEQMQQQLRAWRATGAESARPYYLALLAETYGKAGEPDKGLSVLAECWPWMDKTGGRVFEAELYRIRGELILQKFQVSSSHSQATDTRHPTPDIRAEAEAYFDKALEIARGQEAKSLELRAATSLSRLWRQQGKTAAARQVLEEIYGWFTEGFETTDLQAAESLLATLGSQLKPPPSTARRAPAAPGQQSFPVVSTSLARPATSRLPRHRTAREEKAPRVPSPSVEGQAAGLRAVPTDTEAPPAGVFAPPAAAAASRISDYLFRREGEYWTLAFAGTVCRIKDSRGLHYLAQLLHRPQEELHAVQLVTGGVALQEPDQPGLARRGNTDEGADREDHPVSGFANVGDVLDPQARAAYRRRLEDLQAELEEARVFNDSGRTEKLQGEIDFLTQELARAVGLGGQARRAGSAAERARVNVRRTIKAAIKRIMDSHPALGHHLTQTIKTGTYCSYTPDSRLPSAWRI